MRALASWSPIVARRRALAFLLALAPACAEDDPAVEPLAPLAQQAADAGAADAAAPDFGIPNLPDCARYLAEKQWVFGYPYPADLQAAAASRNGYVLLAFDGLDIPVLKLVRTPDRREPENLHTLLPEPLRRVSALSEIRGDQVLAVHGAGGAEPLWISAFDLAQPSLIWSRPLAAPAAVVQGERPTLVKHVALRADGRYDVLVMFGAQLYLVGFERDGAPRYQTLIHPELRDWEQPSLVTREDGSMLIALDLRDDHRQPFVDAHQLAFHDLASGASVPVLLTVAETGQLVSIDETRVPAHSATLAGNLTMPGGRPTWFVEDWGLPQQMMVSRAPGDAAPLATATPFRHRTDALFSMAVLDDDLWIAGGLDRTYGFKATLTSSRPFLGRFSADGELHIACAEARPPRDPMDSRSPMWDVRLHPTQLPLVSARTRAPSIGAMWIDRVALFALRVYLMAEPEEP